MKTFKRAIWVLSLILLFAGQIYGEVTGPPAGGFGALIDPSDFKVKWLDVPYAHDSKTQTLDIYLPEGDGPFPLVVAVHGGAWEMGDKNDGQATSVVMAVTARGYAAASLNYRLTDEVIFPGQIYDVKAAIRFLRANAEKYNIDPDRVAIWGNSAGGHLAGLAGTTGDVSELEDLSIGNPKVSSRVQAVVTWFGGFDLGAMGTSDPLVKLFGASPETVPALVKKANPTVFISPDDPPFFVEHGSSDSLVPVSQSIVFSQELTKVLGAENVKLKVIEGAEHGDKAFDTAENLEEVVSFLDACLK
jgi:acetyl esterase/lipase